MFHWKIWNGNVVVLLTQLSQRQHQLTVHIANDKVDTIIPGICHIQYETRNDTTQLALNFLQRTFFTFLVQLVLKRERKKWIWKIYDIAWIVWQWFTVYTNQTQSYTCDYTAHSPEYIYIYQSVSLEDSLNFDKWRENKKINKRSRIWCLSIKQLVYYSLFDSLAFVFRLHRHTTKKYGIFKNWTVKWYFAYSRLFYSRDTDDERCL